MNTLMSGKTILNKLLALFIIGTLALSPIMSLELQASRAPVPLKKDERVVGEILGGTGVVEAGDLAEQISLVVQWALGFIGIVVFLIFLFAGFEYATAGGDEGKASTATKRMVNAVIGLIIIFFAFVASNAVLSFVFQTA